MNRPSERSVLVTRPGGPGDPLAVRLAAAGLRVHAVPTVVVRPAAPGGALDGAIEQAGRFAWIAITSVHGVEAVAAAMGRAKTPGRPGTPPRAGTSAMPASVARVTAVPLPAAAPRWPAAPAPPAAPVPPPAAPARPAAPRWPRIAVVGPATARAATRAGMTVDAVAEDGTGVGIAAAIERAEGTSLAGLRILLPRASAAPDDLPTALHAAGAEVDQVVAYETVEAPAASREPLLAALADASLVAAAVASGSAVRGLVALASAGPPDALARVRALPFVSIGPSTSAEVRRLGLLLGAEAAHPTAESLAGAVIDAVGGLRSSSPRAFLEVPR